jgi:ligand-binding sensor domain-containing protein
VWDSAREWATDEIADALEQGSVEALAIDPVDNRLWVGTPHGLFSERPWRHNAALDVRALAFGPGSDRTLWVGTATGLERWRASRSRQLPEGRIARFMTTASGLAANTVTALAVRTIADAPEVWIGSPAGLSRYRYSI